LEELHPGLLLGVKWPNDVWIGTRKVGGVLLESRDGADPLIVAGIGLNLRPPSGGWGALRGLATSLEEEGIQLSPDRVLDALLPALERAFDRFENRGFRGYVSAFNARSILRNRPVLIERGGRTEDVLAVRVDPDGSLRVRDAHGRERSLVAGDVRVRPGAQA
jgi:BirA family biotin operon repressor/biotin-[acetyl-CoA-carboxylase] ligase